MATGAVIEIIGVWLSGSSLAVFSLWLHALISRAEEMTKHSLFASCLVVKGFIKAHRVSGDNIKSELNDGLMYLFFVMSVQQ
ncbi:hypothetical protein GCM10009111_30950 [Colwellia asteriadis]|uniref:Uncharacterized protein n=1 Tax=Colwellia asteriadis TaxID=517723 RepID=A0ABN1LAB2_9GAMM